MDIKCVGRVGVAPVQMVGGPHDGEVRWAVLGSAVTLKVRVPKKSGGLPMVSWRSMFYGMSSAYGIAEPEENWKDATAKAMMDVWYAVYLPQMRDGKATGILKFEDMFAVQVPIAAPVTTTDNDDEED